MKKKLLLPFAILFATGPAIAAQPVEGRWITQEKDAIVEIGQCGSTVCGRIAKYLVPPPQGVGQKDVNNPDKALRGRTLLGLAVLSGFTQVGNEWKGRIYDPKSGKSYRSVIYRDGASGLTVKGCIAFFCQSQKWTRAR
ncbi:MAG: DUF2147 domain-containing protein [Parasphingorhabdus sp.]|nr:DUF2147 domain-containing protein [Parasphingorhabdus sp.]